MNIFSFITVSGTYTVPAGWTSVLIVPNGPTQVVNHTSPPQSITITSPLKIGNGGSIYSALTINGSANIIVNGDAISSPPAATPPSATAWGDITGTITNQTDLVAYIPSIAWARAGNTLAARAIFGSVSGAFGWDERLNNVVIGGVNNDTTRFYGTTASFASTSYSLKSIGNDSSTNHSQWNNSDDTVLGFLRNDGLLKALKFEANTTVDTGTPDAAFRANRILSSNSASGHGFRDQTDFRQAGFSYAAFDAASLLNSGVAANFGHMIAFQSRIEHSTEGTTDEMIGLGDYTQVNNGTVNNLLGFVSLPNVAASFGGAAVNRFGARIYDIGGTGTISGTNYGIYINDLVRGTTDNYAIYVDGSTKSYFGGSIAIGNAVSSVSPTSPNRTVTMSVGGVTLYLHAKTTND